MPHPRETASFDAVYPRCRRPGMTMTRFLLLLALAGCSPGEPDVRYQGRSYAEWYQATSDADWPTRSRAEQVLSELAFTNADVRAALYRDLTSGNPEKEFRASWILRRMAFKGGRFAGISLERFRADRDSIPNARLKEELRKLVIDAEADSVAGDSVNAAAALRR
jgi:hypothetical protein